MNECSPVTTPMIYIEKFTKQEAPISGKEIEIMKNVPYQKAVGSLLFAAQVSRPDISFAVNCVSRFNNNPELMHWAAVKRILRYMKRIKQWKLTFGGNKPFHFLGYSD